MNPVWWLLVPPCLAVDIGWDQVRIEGLQQGARDVAQDGDGFLWFATVSGLVRYDGERTVVLAGTEESTSFWSVEMAVGTVWAFTRPGRLFRVENASLEAVIGADGQPGFVRAMAGDEQSLWTYNTDGQLWRYDGEEWVDLTPDEMPTSAHVFSLRSTGEGVFLASRRGLWRVGVDGQSVRIRDDLVVDVGELSDGRLVVQAMDLEISEPTGWRSLVPHQHSRAIGLAVRDDVVFLEYDQWLFRVTPEGAVDRVTTVGSGGPPLGPPPFVARDNTLWLGNVRLLEPDTVRWGEGDGAPTAGRWIAVGADGVAYFSAWGGSMRLDRNGVRASNIPGTTMTFQVCLTGDDQAIGFLGREGVANLSTEDVLVPDLLGSACSTNPRGNVWLVTVDGELLEVRDKLLHRYEAPRAGYRAVIETRQRTLVTVGGTTACEVPVEQLDEGAPAWTCTALPTGIGPNMTCLIEPKPGVVWACTEGSGLYERTAPHTWQRAVVSDLLTSSDVARSRVAPSGHVWVGDGIWMVRLAERDGTWQVEERLGVESGLADGVFDVAEDVFGNLWTSGPLGVSFVSAERRQEAPEVTPHLVAVYVEGEPASQPVTMPASASVEFQFATLSYRYPDSLRYRWRLGQAQWSTPTRSGTIRLAGLAGGGTTVQVEVSAGGGDWSEPLEISLVIIPPWYQQRWFWALLSLGAVLATLGVFRLRALAVLRAEQQRARIAMDLHDELGAGLGSISILAGLLNSRRIGPDRARKAAYQIASSAEELGAAVTDIVWSLRTQEHTLESLLAYVHDRGQTLFVGEDVRVRLVAPEPLPLVRLAPTMARAVQLVLVEAMYNAFKHAKPTQLIIEAQQEGRAWTISIADNGAGFDPKATLRLGGGTGLTSMKKRAESVGASLYIGPNKPRGVRVQIHFRPA